MHSSLSLNTKSKFKCFALFRVCLYLCAWSIDCPLEWCVAHTRCPPGKYTKRVGTATTQPGCEVCPTGLFKAYASASSTTTDSCTTAHIECPAGKHAVSGGSITSQHMCAACMTGFYKTSASSSSTDACVAHTKCPAGKYTAVSGSATTQPECESCATGFFKSIASKSSIVETRKGKGEGQGQG